MKTTLLSINFLMTAKSDKAKETVSKQIEKILKSELIKIPFLQNINIDRSNDAKYIIPFTYDNWCTVIYEISKFSESLANGWIRTGNIDLELNLSSTKPRLNGVTVVNIVVSNS